MLAPQLWLQPYPTGEPRRITDDWIEYRTASVDASGTAIVTIGQDINPALWRVPLDGSAPQRISPARAEGLYGVAALPDNRAVVSSRQGSTAQLLLIAADGSRQQLTSSGFNTAPAATPDGRVIAFGSIAMGDRVSGG